MSLAQWREGQRVKLLENGEEYFAAVYDAIGAAQREVLIETFILFDDPVGQRLRDVIVAAARRGVQVQITVDGYGSADLTTEFVKPMTELGVLIHVYDPVPRLFGKRTRIFRRLHRKIVVVDRRLAYIGGINFSHDHNRDFGELSKQDYAVEIEGPVVGDIHALAVSNLPPQRHAPRPRWWHRRTVMPTSAPIAPAGDAGAALVVRDNARHRDDIERVYRIGIRAAKREILIANAYFFPGYRLLRDLRRAAQRGVKVQLILQGKPDMWYVRWAANTLHDYLLRAGVRICEYGERPLHAKVAVIDDDWVTVGSSNLDPLSLFLNLESNLVIRERALADTLRASLQRLLSEHCQAVPSENAHRPRLLRQILSYLAYHASRKLPAWAGWVPAHTPQRTSLSEAVDSGHIDTSDGNAGKATS